MLPIPAEPSRVQHLVRRDVIIYSNFTYPVFGRTCPLWK